MSEGDPDERFLMLLNTAYKNARYETNFKVGYDDLCTLNERVTLLLAELKRSVKVEHIDSSSCAFY